MIIICTYSISFHSYSFHISGVDPDYDDVPLRAEKVIRCLLPQCEKDIFSFFFWKLCATQDHLKVPERSEKSSTPVSSPEVMSETRDDLLQVENVFLSLFLTLHHKRQCKRSMWLKLWFNIVTHSNGSHHCHHYHGDCVLHCHNCHNHHDAGDPSNGR